MNELRRIILDALSRADLKSINKEMKDNYGEKVGRVFKDLEKKRGEGELKKIEKELANAGEQCVKIVSEYKNMFEKYSLAKGKEKKLNALKEMKNKRYGTLSYEEARDLFDVVGRRIQRGDSNVIIGLFYLHKLGKLEGIKNRIKKIVGQQNFSSVFDFLVQVGRFPIDAIQ